jgi:hypothetical protein
LDGPLYRILIPSSSARAVKPSWQCNVCPVRTPIPFGGSCRAGH